MPEKEHHKEREEQIEANDWRGVNEGYTAGYAVREEAEARPGRTFYSVGEEEISLHPSRFFWLV